MATNRDRIEWAEAALEAFCAETGQSWEDREGAEEALTDLLCDLMHFAAHHGVSFQDCLKGGLRHYRYESAPGYLGD